MAPQETKTDWRRLESTTNADILGAVAGDPDAAPILTPEQIEREYRPAPARIKR